MTHVKLLTFIFAMFFIFKNAYCQESIELGKYITKNKLGYLTLLDNNEFGYISFQGESPYTYSLKEKKQNFCDAQMYSINEKGFGKYQLRYNNLKLIFDEKPNPLDSITVKKISARVKPDSILVNFIVKTYAIKEVENQVLGVSINSEDNKIQLNTSFENNVVLNLDANKLPITFVINSKNKVTINENVDHLVYLYFNEFKLFITKKIENKEIEFDKLLKLEMN